MEEAADVVNDHCKKKPFFSILVNLFSRLMQLSHKFKRAHVVSKDDLRNPYNIIR